MSKVESIKSQTTVLVIIREVQSRPDRRREMKFNSHHLNNGKANETESWGER